MAAGTDVEQYAKALQQAGYATDPKYAEKITRIANSELMQSTLQSTLQGTPQETTQTSAVMEVPRG
jgi:flagellar protein FlgJ